MKKLVSALLLAASLSACASLPEGERIGEPMQSGAVHTFAAVDASPADYFEQTVLVEGTVTAVCKKMGCWMQIEDEGATAMVRWEEGCGGRYAFPESAIGKRVVIQGSVYPKTISDEDAEHLAEEAGGELEVEREGYELNASAILVRD